MGQRMGINTLKRSLRLMQPACRGFVVVVDVGGSSCRGRRRRNSDSSNNHRSISSNDMTRTIIQL